MKEKQSKKKKGSNRSNLETRQMILWADPELAVKFKAMCLIKNMSTQELGTKALRNLISKEKKNARRLFNLSDQE